MSVRSVALFVLLSSIAVLTACDSKPKKKKEAKGEARTEKTKDGVTKSYFADGSVRAEIPMKDGKKHGVAIEYYQGGIKFQEVEYKEGIKEGVGKRYYATGQLAQQTEYKAGKIHGLQQKFRENGKMSSEARFVYDEPCKGLKEYLVDGSLKKKYPHIIIKEDNRLHEGVYALKISMSEKVREVEYFTGKLGPDQEIGPSASKIWTTDRFGNADIEMTVLPGQFIMENVNIIAKVKTALGNYYITEKSINVAVENR